MICDNCGSDKVDTTNVDMDNFGRSRVICQICLLKENHPQTEEHVIACLYCFSGAYQEDLEKLEGERS